MKNIRRKLYFAGIALVLFIVGCSDPMDEITSLTFDRLFSPTEFKAVVLNKTNALISFNSVRGAEGYVAEVYYRSDSTFSSPYKTINGITGSPDTIKGLEGETKYLIRLKAISSANKESKWVTDTITTGAEQVLYAVSDSDLTAKSVVLRWAPGLNVSSVTLSSDGTEVVNHTLTSEEIEAGVVSISGLTGSTVYTAKIFNGTKQRGTISFTTLIDIGDAIAVYPDDDLVAMLNAANNGDAFVLMAGNYVLGDYSITKSISISGYKASEKPVIYGKFTCSSTVGYLNLKNVILDGTATSTDVSQRTSVFEVSTGCNLSGLSFTGCEIRNYVRTLIYNNTSGTSLGNIVISDCIVHDFPGTGGDGIDIRTGALTSLKVENSTFYKSFRSFLRLQVSADVTFTNCTLYKICILEDSNNSGLFRASTGGTLSVSNCLFVGIGSTSYGNWCKSASNMKATTSYSNNIYYNSPNLWAGYYTSSTGVASEANPQFADPTNANFTVGNALVTAGDPRWLSN